MDPNQFMIPRMSPEEDGSPATLYHNSVYRTAADNPVDIDNGPVHYEQVDQTSQHLYHLGAQIAEARQFVSWKDE